MYLRFVTAEIDPDSQCELGIFQALENLRSQGKLLPHEEIIDDEIGLWFDKHLKKPTRFTNSKPPFYRKPNKAISWFKDSAKEHISQVRQLIAIAENHGIHVKTLTIDRVGYVVYEDEFQIVAEPFASELH